ncbi:hypothetical protein JW310_18120 [Enterobacter cloacae subsp. cloacae]|uniref:hypothetical protein n=1 Tax=Enterobacter cloacae TaxID=550 RepID=UPI001C5B3473|nr:hypothetical protein [Enterobacter cloacae]ELK6490477.1 hypothetical protein [Enterobacter bugandensis]MBW4198557.1 hypothetical protein [Enterobacter cloacae subsp. cloacae]
MQNRKQRHYSCPACAGQGVLPQGYRVRVLLTIENGQVIHQQLLRPDEMAMSLRCREKKKLSPVLAAVQAWSQPQLSGFDTVCGEVDE